MSKMFQFRVKDEDFVKSSWSKNNPKTCVEVAIKPKGVALRDSKVKGTAPMFFTHSEWKAFTKGVRSGEFDKLR